MKNPVGRPPLKNAITKTGKLFMLWLNTREMDYLDVKVIELGMSKAEYIRRLIQKDMTATR